MYSKVFPGTYFFRANNTFDRVCVLGEIPWSAELEVLPRSSTGMCSLVSPLRQLRLSRSTFLQHSQFRLQVEFIS
jgi:hypothetical protein